REPAGARIGRPVPRIGRVAAARRPGPRHHRTTLQTELVDPNADWPRLADRPRDAPDQLHGGVDALLLRLVRAGDPAVHLHHARAHVPADAADAAVHGGAARDPAADRRDPEEILGPEAPVRGDDEALQGARGEPAGVPRPAAD